MRTIQFEPDFQSWRTGARAALTDGVPPGQIFWQPAGEEPAPTLDLFGNAAPAAARVAQEPAALGKAAAPPRVPPAFMELARRAACHRSAGRWDLLYRVLWRLTHGEPHLLQVYVDADVHQLMRMDKAVRRDVHKMRAFVRFREVAQEDGQVCSVAWFEPAHLIVELNSRFFVDRFAGMRWSILTPDRCVHWQGKELSFTPGVDRSAAPNEDAVEGLWRTYYAHIFNPARLKLNAMKAEMPRFYWKNLPEAALIPGLIQGATARVEAMIEQSREKKG